MINFEALLQKVNEKGDGGQHVEVKPIDDGKTFTLELRNPGNFSLKNIIRSSIRGLEFEDSINEEVYIYKSGLKWEAAKYRFTSDNQIEYWLERELRNPEEFYDYLFEECRTSENYYKDDEIAVVASERPVIKTALGVHITKIHESDIKGYSLSWTQSF